MQLTFVVLVVLALGLVECQRCPIFCTFDYNPVCGRSPTKGFRTFPNACALRSENECNRGDFKLYRPGPCRT